MEEIETKLIEVIKIQLDRNIEEKTEPSEATLNSVYRLIQLYQKDAC